MKWLLLLYNEIRKVFLSQRQQPYEAKNDFFKCAHFKLFFKCVGLACFDIYLVRRYSMRRFFRRPVSVSLLATGTDEP